MAKVFVGLSGGVDSAVSAALLLDAGHDVTGVFIKIWSPQFLECTWQDDRLEAKRVAAHLGIPFKEIDLSEEYMNSVVYDMLENYKKGFTPNPDVLCNRRIKFGAFAEWAHEHGAEKIATGHYARISEKDGRYELSKGIDPGKDQSYFLYRLDERELAAVYFPVGGFSKTEIREKALEFKLPNAMRPDSQGLCFVGDVSMHEFLGRFIKLRRGTLISAGGDVLGEHDGAALYTIGQRHGLHLSPSSPSGPYYVTAIDTQKNLVTVSRDQNRTKNRRARLSDVHWISGQTSRVEAVSRYHARAVPAVISGTQETYTIDFESAVQLTPGQSLVFYRGNVCMGGAVIQSVEA